MRVIRDFAPPVAQGTVEEKRTFARLFVQKIEVDPGTGKVLMHLFSRPPARAEKATPASTETGVRIGLVAGACYTAVHNALASVLVRRWRLPGRGRRTRVA